MGRAWGVRVPQAEIQVGAGQTSWRWRAWWLSSSADVPTATELSLKRVEKVKCALYAFYYNKSWVLLKAVQIQYPSYPCSPCTTCHPVTTEVWLCAFSVPPTNVV